MQQTRALLERIADALDRLSPPALPPVRLDAHDAFVWHGEAGRLEPVPQVDALDPSTLAGIDRQRALVLDNTLRFAAGHRANNVLLWGARGMGKSSLVKAAHRAANDAVPHALALVEIARDELASLPALLSLARATPSRRVVAFCDDLAFDPGEADYKALKSVLDGGIAGRPANVLFYATSNRRHLMARDMIDNAEGNAINPGEAVEEKVSLSDRFGLSVGFHGCDQATYLAMVSAHAARLRVALDPEALAARALTWSVTRGARSGRVAAQFVEDLVGRQAGSGSR